MKSYIGIDLGGTSVKGARIKGGKLERKEISNISPPEDSNEILNRICKIIDNLWCEEISGIGFAVPALIDFESGTMHGLSNIQQLNGFPIQAALQEKYDVPVRLQNDANCFVLGEKYFGYGRNFQNIVGLITGTGVGAGIILNNKLYNGTNMGAGEFGMVPYKKDCYEHYCSGKFFRDEYKTSGEKLYNLAMNGNKKAIHIFNEYGQQLGDLIKLICYTLDPQVILIGGSVSNAFEFYKTSMEESMQSFFFQTKSKPQIIPSQIKEIALYGAVSLLLDKEELKVTSLKLK